MKRHVWLLFLTVAGVLLSGCDMKEEPMTVGVESVSLNKTSTSLLVGGTEQLVATVLPEDAANKKVYWSSSSEDVALVDVETGLVRGMSEGVSTITVTTDDGGKQASCEVKVTTQAVAVSGVTLSEETLLLEVGKTHGLTATVSPDDATNQNVVWSSDAEDVASVDATTGLVTALSAGTAEITATTEDGGYTASCAATVTADMEEYLKGLLLDAFGKMGFGEDFFTERGWSLDNPLEDWGGISVREGPAGYELSIIFSGQPLAGTLCDELFRLPGLTRLVLSGCYLSGPIPESFGEATQLTSLRIGENNFTGTIPESIGNLTRLETLDLSELSSLDDSPFPAWVGKLTALIELDMAGCNLTGELPASLGNLTDLESLDVGDNKLTGAVPEEVKGLANYSNFYFNPQLDGYEITGTEAGDTDKAVLLSIRETWGTDAPQQIRDSWTEENAVTDFYGVEVNGLGQVTVLDLSFLNISSVPDMSALTQLKVLNLNENNLTQFPVWVCNLTNLEYLDLYYNNLSGVIPDEVLSHPSFSYWRLTPQNDGYGFDNDPVSSEMSKVRSLNNQSAEKEAVRSARKAEIRERILREER